MMRHVICLGLWLAASAACAGERPDIVVALDGTGHFTTVQAAVDSVPAASGRLWTILIKRGTYREQVSIRKGNIALVGEDRLATRIIFPVLREEWNAAHGGSDRGAGVVNIDTGVTDVTLANLTVYNNYGLTYGVPNKHQFAIRGAGTRIILLSCTVISDGGDAVSLWNKQDGMYYHADCTFEGWVDFVCPRGWCYITRSKFFGHNTPSASIWHDGSADSTQKLVITDSFFDGVSGFPLGRNHLDAQFYLLRCRFSANMADRPFVRPPSSPAPWRWGDRHYFYSCHRDGGDYAWFADNLNSAAGSPEPSEVTAQWTFSGRWDPEASLPRILELIRTP
jgi:pectinesterase